MRARAAGALALDVLFPRRCAFCGRVKGFSAACTCDEKREGLRLKSDPIDFAATHRELCCLREAWAAYRYEGAVRGAILRMKQQGAREAAKPLGQAMAALAVERGLAGAYDLAVPVPVSARTLKKRGYNQSALLAMQVCAATGLPLEPRALGKAKETRRQMTLDRQARKTNVQGAFAAGAQEAIQGKRVLLIDDVFTTGSTLDECAKALLEAGAAGCGGLCAAAVVYGKVVL